MIMLDTHTLIWWTLDPDRLSKKAAARCNDIINTRACISSISIWEIGIKIKNGALDIGMTIHDYCSKVKELNCVDIIPVDENTWIESILLKWENKDPADRVIVATAKRKGIPLISKDERIKAFYRNTVW